MEAGESGTRQSGIPPASNTSSNHPSSNPFDQRHREPFDRSYREGQNMATAALISPSASFHHGHHHSSSSSSFSPGYPHSAPAFNGPGGMVSPVDSRRKSGESDTTHRHSLPSIQEVISASKPQVYAPVLPSTQNLPSPFPSTPRGYSHAAPPETNPSPRSQHSSSFSQPGSLSALSDPTRAPPPSNRPPPPPPLITPSHQQHQAPAVRTDQNEAEQKQTDSQPVNASFSQPPHPPAAPYAQSGVLPPGQLPLPMFSPREVIMPTLPSPFESPRPPVYGDDREFNRDGRGNKYESAISRHFEAWSYIESLDKIAMSCRTMYNFAEAFVAAAREQGGNQPVPSRLPTDAELNDMRSNAMLVKKTFDDLHAMVSQTRMGDRSRDPSVRGPYEDEDTAMYGDENRNRYMADVKKRRGRAAPPGRCHSCNRIDTPEWRRGPDGARTLCNACGLHYAKLERKRQMEARTIRPKPPLPPPIPVPPHGVPSAAGRG